MTRSPSALASRLLSALAVAVAVPTGIWVAGAVLTNDFKLAMALTVGWMAVAGLVCLAVAARARQLRWSVLGAYAVSAAAAGIYLGSAVVVNREVDERVATAPIRANEPAGEPRAPVRQQNVRLASGGFQSVRHAARGTATAIRLASGRRVLTLTGFEVDSGPDLRVYLARGPARDETQVEDFVDLGALKGSRGNQQYLLPARVDLGRHRTVVIWCRAFSVLFARAPLRG